MGGSKHLRDTPDEGTGEATTVQWPIVYSPNYNVRFGGLEKLHPFDAQKWRHVFDALSKSELQLSPETTVSPKEASDDILLKVHTKRYLKSLRSSFTVAGISEIPLLVLVPNFLVQRSYLKPMRFQTQGTVDAGLLALNRGWAVNIGGGLHHCSRDRGGGFCPYADITILIETAFTTYPERVKKVMIVDLDAHQGNGHERDFAEDQRVYIMDVYNGDIYPRDKVAKRSIRKRVELSSYTDDSDYLRVVERNLESSLSEFHPDLLVYNAGTDILVGDSLGHLSVSAQGIIRRDEIVFMKARERRIPIVMLTSGGYLKVTANIIADSIINLFHIGLIKK